MANNDERELGQMLVSKAKSQTVQVDVGKVSRGSFFTTDASWLTDSVRSFLTEAFATAGSALDPFAGDGHLLQLLETEFGVSTDGFDIHGDRWPNNDSLLNIPNGQRSVIVTNPPYLANHSAKRKGVQSLTLQYFAGGRDNLYKVALDRCLESADFVVAIIPETFLLADYPFDRLVLASVIEQALFADTDAPALVACFAPAASGLGKSALVYVSDRPVATLSQILASRLPSGSSKRRLRFNEPTGRIGFRAVDGTAVGERIRFMPADDFSYPRSGVKVSSRLMTYLEIFDLDAAALPAFCAAANELLESIRTESQDLALAPFKGNNKAGRRRRRLDYELARRILLSTLEDGKYD